MKGQMKITYSILGLAAGAALFLANGCGKQEQPSGETPKATPPAASDMQKAAEAPKPATEPAPAAVAAATDASQAASAAASDAQTAVSSAASEAQKAVESPKAAAEHAQPPAPATPAQAVAAPASQTDAASAPVAAPSAMSTQAQALIDKAKGLVTTEKYQDALKVVQQLSSLKLTAEQQKLVDGLKAQIQTALAKVTATDAASALGNVLGGKK